MKVLMTVRPGGAGANPFADIFEDALPSSVTLIRFRWAKAIFGGYDVLHVQWPEYLFRGSTFPRAALRFWLGAALLMRIAITRVPVVYTAHNLRPHESVAWGERTLTRALLRRADLTVYLNESDENDYTQGIVILHFRYPEAPHGDRVRHDDGPFLFFGLIRPYKGIEQLIEAWRASATARELRIRGPVQDPTYADRVQALAEGAGAEAVFGYASEDALDEELSAAAGVILPYERMYNSGAVVRALSRARPVLVPRSGSTETLREEIGGSWVTLFDAPLDADDVRSFAGGIAGIAEKVPDLDRRDPAAHGELHAIAYHVLKTHRREGRLSRRRSVIAALRSDTSITAHSSRNRAGSGIPRARTEADASRPRAWQRKEDPHVRGE